jgi:3-isopropylmalate/(R)-2-methylmalate dehydratase small subunit
MANATGRAWKFGDDISTDLICPGRYAHLRTNLRELAKHTLEDARSDYIEGVQPGDFVVAGSNFGLGSSREHAAIIIRLSGAQAVVARSFARIFFRNCINVGLPAVQVDTDQIDEGDGLALDLEAGVLRDVTNGKEFAFPPLPPVMARILADGGLVEHLKKHGDFFL